MPAELVTHTCILSDNSNLPLNIQSLSLISTIQLIDKRLYSMADILNRVFSALADPVRRTLLERLDGKTLPVSELAEPFSISLQAVSKHIQVLVRAGLIEQQRTGRISQCSLNAGPIMEAAVWLNRYSKYWQSQFDTLAALLTDDAPAAVPKTPHPHPEKPMNYVNAQERVNALREQITTIRAEIKTVQQQSEPEVVRDYTLKTPDGEVSLSELFGDHDTLFLIHNMGASCRYCTLWADGFNGIVNHLENRGAFVVTSPDSPDAQTKFAASRDWRFRMVSHEGSTMADDLGYRKDGGWWPGMSVLKRTKDGIQRVGDAAFGPGDDFSAIWHMMDLLPEGANGWEPQYAYR